MAILRNLWEDRRRFHRPVVNVPFTQEVTMGSEERDMHKHGAREEPDVEAHMHKHGARDEGKPEPEDREDDGPDVEAHMHKHG
jgi:hypothetical protein